MRVLVTGHRGFIGSRLWERIDADEVMGVDRLESADLLDLDVLAAIEEFAPQVVYHLAAEHVVPWCRAHPTETLATNVVGTIRLLSAVRRSCSRFVLASSAAVYGFGPEPFSESAPRQPADVYGESKLLAEEALRTWVAERRLTGVSGVALRLFNVVGPGDRNQHVLPALIARYLTGERIRHGNLAPRRDYVHVDDVVRALTMPELHALAGFNTANVGTGIGTSVGDLLLAIQEAGGHPLEPEPDPELMRLEDGDLVADTSKLRGLGWAPRRTLADAIREGIEIG